MAQAIQVEYRNIAQFDDDVVQEAIGRLIKEETSTTGMFSPMDSKLFLIPRMMFKVPSKASWSDDPYLGHWGNPTNGNFINLLWPFREDVGTGSITLEGRFTMYTGVPYNPLEEFVWLKIKYPRRFPNGK